MLFTNILHTHYTVSQKTATLLLIITLANIDRFSKFFHHMTF